MGLMRRILELGKKLLLATLGIAAVAIPLSSGLTHPPKMRAQSPLTAAPMRFEAALVKFPADQSILETRPRRTVGRFRWKTQLLYLLGYAYHLEWWRISEKPASGSVSLGSIYEIEATTGPDVTEDQERLMPGFHRPAKSNSVMASAPGFSRPCGIPPAAPVRGL